MVAVVAEEEAGVAAAVVAAAVASKRVFKEGVTAEQRQKTPNIRAWNGGQMNEGRRGGTSRLSDCKGSQLVNGKLHGLGREPDAESSHCTVIGYGMAKGVAYSV